MIIYPYRDGSKSVKALKEALDVKVIKLENSKFKGNPDKVVINWGNSNMTDELAKCKVVNRPDAVKLASNKLNFFEAVKDVVSIPPYTLDKEEARKWIMDGKTVIVREQLTGSGGAGIVILDNIATFEEYNHDPARMYTMYIPKKTEWRVHVSLGEIIDLQRKALDRERFNPDHVDFRIRNHQFGFIFVRQDNENCPACVKNEAIKAVKAVGLDFGAVDVIYNERHDKAYVLEINTAPGLEGQTVDNYKKVFEKVSEPKPDQWIVDNGIQRLNMDAFWGMIDEAQQGNF